MPAIIAMRTRSDRLLACHLGHQIGAVDFDGARADAEIEGDGLVGVAGHQAFQHLPLAVRQRGQLVVNAGELGLALAGVGARLSAERTAASNRSSSNGFSRKSTAPIFIAFDRERHIAVAGDHDHRKTGSGLA